MAESLAIEVEAEPVIDAAITVGDSVQLRAATTGGRRPGSARDAQWLSETPAVASVSGSGMVRGMAEGTTRVIATSGSLADTIFVTVLTTPPASGYCGPNADDALLMAVGQVYTTTAAAAPKLCVRGGSDYVIIPTHAARSGSLMRVEMKLATSAAAPSPAPQTTSADLFPSVSTAATTAERLHQQLREKEARELSPLIASRRPSATPRFAISPAAVPVVGGFLDVNVNSSETCNNAITRRARVAVVSTRAIVLTDEKNPVNGFSTADLLEFGRLFDEVIYPTVTANFGEPTDLDGNGRVILMFTRAVNEMTPPKSDSYTAGFFFARDLFPTSDRDGLKGCPTSNSGELLYMLTPDPGGEVNGNSRSRSFVAERTPGVLAHELQHLVNASRRLRTLALQEWSEEFWLNEGLSHVAEELTYYTASKLQPRNNLDATRLNLHFGTPVSFDQFQANNFSRYSTYLRDTETASPLNGTSLQTRGAIWAFLRYAADRIPNSEPRMWKELVDNDATGYNNLAAAIDDSPLTWMHDWQIAAFTHHVTATFSAATYPAKYKQPSWHFRSVMQSLSGTRGVFPLRVRTVPLGANREELLDLAAGGVAYIRLSSRPIDTITISTTSGGVAPPRSLRLAVVRVR